MIKEREGITPSTYRVACRGFLGNNKMIALAFAAPVFVKGTVLEAALVVLRSRWMGSHPPTLRRSDLSHALDQQGGEESPSAVGDNGPRRP